MSEPQGDKKKGRRVGFLLIVLMVVVASCLLLVLGICGGGHLMGRLSFERKSIGLAVAAVGMVTRKGDNGRHPDWKRIIPILTLIGAAGLCVWLLVWAH